MENPFNLSQEKLIELITSYEVWLKSDPKEEKYPVTIREQSQRIRDGFLNEQILSAMSDDELYDKIFKYSRNLEGPAWIKLGKERITYFLPQLRRNLKYIATSKEEPNLIALKILDGEYRIEVFAKAFWSPILLAQFPDRLPNWNNKTEKFLRNFDINLSTSKLSIAERYKILSEAFIYLSSLVEGHDFYTINHLMHYGTVIPEGIRLIDKLKGGKASDPVIEMIKKYKDQIREKGLKDELYKWELLKKYRGRPNLEAPDFLTEVKSIDFKNLMYPIAIAVKNHIANDLPTEFRECLVKLFNEDEDLTSRVKAFMDNMLKVYRKLEAKLGHHHDERTIATYLTYHDPEKYTFFKDSYYQKYCKLINEEAKPKGEKYSHFMELVANFRDEYILPDTELIGRVRSFMNSDCFDDPNNLVLAQDILYQTLDKGEDIIDITTERIYKISMGEFKREDFRDAVSNNIVIVHKDTKPKGGSSLAQGDTFVNSIKEGDYFYLTYGNKGVELLGRFVGDPRPSRNTEMASKGWIERTFEEVASSINQSVYKAKKKWWTPNDNSTCIEIHANELDESNKLIFKPYFKTVFRNEGTKIKVDEFEPEYEESKFYDAPLNTILYGPPGTGKTYHTIDLAVKIAAPNEYAEGDHITNKAIYELLAQTGQVVFTTFHQSMCYEDFIEGIKPTSDDNGNLNYSVEDGLFKKLAINAAFEFISERSSDASKYLNFSAAYDHLFDEVNEKIGNDEKYTLMLKSGSELEIVEVTSGNNFLVQHKNGSRTYTVSRKRLEKLFSELPELETVTNINEEIRKVIGGSNASAYWAVLKKLRSFNENVIQVKVDKTYSYEDKAAAVEKLQLKDLLQTGNEKKYVLIIDEINRGNVSQVFGELITLIEEDKRFGNSESLSAILPYSRSRFFVPTNLYIIGTMNTADRSVEALDTALRRRFSFIEKVPLYNLYCMELELAGVKIAKLLEAINNRIEKLVDRDHQIGHSYFLGFQSEEDLMQGFRDKIIPLLQEYFYGNYEKMGLVLGSGFIAKLPDEKVVFASFPAEEQEFNDKIIYRINVNALEDVNEFTKALSLLMNKPQE